jgi:hypothetical protein
MHIDYIINTITATIGKLPPMIDIIPPKAKGINKENNNTTPNARNTNYAWN